MNKTFKRTFATITALGLLSCSALAVEVDPTEQPVLISENPVTESAPVVNGATLTAVPVENINGVDMIPLRAVCEGLGFRVNWIEEGQSIEVIKGAVFITMSIDTDSYAFSRRAPQQLGAAPTLVDDSVTHVPLAFITDILGGYYTQSEDGTLKIVNPSIVTVTEVQENGALLVSDSALGEVLVLIDENTQITANGETVSKDALKADMVLGIEYSEAMTASLPPQATAVAIRIENTEEATEETPVSQGVAFEGVLFEIRDNMVILGDPEEDNDSIALLVDENTQITKGLDRRIYKLDDLEVGMKLSGLHAEQMTTSIPGQSLAFTIHIHVEEEIAEEAPATIAFEGTISEIDGNMIILGDPTKDSDSIALLIDENTQITKGLDRRIYKLDDLEVGMKVSGTRSDIATMSLPPQSLALTLVIGNN